jgi:hypothetical protein
LFLDSCGYGSTSKDKAEWMNRIGHQKDLPES